VDSIMARSRSIVSPEAEYILADRFCHLEILLHQTTDHT
jgi:hypothetical protein